MEVLIQLLVNGIIAGGTYAVVALGYGLVYGTLKFPNFAHGTVALVGAYAVYWLARDPFHLPFGLAVFLAVVLTAGVGILIEFIAYRHWRGVYWLAPLVTTIAIALVLQAVVMLLTGSRPMTYGFPVVRGLEIGPVLITPVQIIMVVGSVTLMISIYAVLTLTKLGKAMRAVADDVPLAELCGIDSNYIIDWVFAIGSACAAVAGILFGLDTTLTHNMGTSMTIKSFAAVILGGLGSIQGAVIGGYLLGIGENLGVWFLPAVWKDSIAFAIMTIGLYIKPTGFYGQAEDKMVLGK